VTQATLPTYWKWFFKGTGAGPGFRRFLSWWLLAHVAVGVTLYFIVPLNLRAAANAVLLPLAGIFIGLSFAWAGNAQALLQTREIETLADYHPGGFEEYVYIFQTAILVILLTLAAWGLAGLGVFDQPSPVSWGYRLYPVVSILLFSLASLTLRECWQVVLMSQLLLLVAKKVKNARDKERKAS
jgi:hypothetical protein